MEVGEDGTQVGGEYDEGVMLKSSEIISSFTLLRIGCPNAYQLPLKTHHFQINMTPIIVSNITK